MILVDNRVGSSFTSSHGRKFNMFDAISTRVNGAASLHRLGSADFAFEGNGPNGDEYIGIERKALGDMIGSMRGGRYAGDQAKTMSETYGISYLIVEGVYRPNKDGVIEDLGKDGWKPMTLAAKGPASKQNYLYSELDKHLCSMELRKNVIVVRSTSHMETVWQVVNRFQWWQKPWDSHQSDDPIKHQAEIAFTRVSWTRQAMACIPGIGWTKSAALEKYFGTWENMGAAMYPEFTQVEFKDKYGKVSHMSEEAAFKLYKMLRGR